MINLMELREILQKRFNKFSLKGKFMVMMTTFLLSLTLVFTFMQGSDEIDRIHTQDWGNIYAHSQELGNNMNQQMRLYEEIFNLICLTDSIQQLVDDVQENATLQSAFDSLSDEEKNSRRFFHITNFRVDKLSRNGELPTKCISLGKWSRHDSCV